MASQTEDTYLRHFVGVLRRRWPIVLGCTVVVVGVALALSLSQPKEYSSKAEILFREVPYGQLIFGSSALPVPNPNRQAATNLKLVALEEVSQRTGQVLGISSAAVRNAISVAPQGEADLVSVTGTWHSAAFAARLANTYVQQYIALRREAEQDKFREAQHVIGRQIEQLTPAQRRSPFEKSLQEHANQLRVLTALQTGGAELASSAVAPSGPSAPAPKRDAILGLLLGLVLGTGLALLVDSFRRQVGVLSPSLDAS